MELVQTLSINSIVSNTKQYCATNTAMASHNVDDLHIDIVSEKLYICSHILLVNTYFTAIYATTEF